MAICFPITLAGDTLGQRLRQLNSMVTTAHQQGLPFSAFQGLREHSAVDRLFKIDLASKHRNLEYILLNLQDEDMLYVSRALKSTWLLEERYRHIINPTYLEENLYPDLTTTAVNKMKHWIHLHLHDASRCKDFFEYYCNKNFDLAVKFLWHCPKDVILLQSNDLLEKMTPKYLKMLCETCPEIVKKFFDSFTTNNTAVANYCDNESEYYDSLKCLLKLNADMYLDIMEKYYNRDIFPRFSAEATKYIMKNQKTRVSNKPELYTIWLLDMNTLANCLDEEEIKQTVRTLAKAEYLESDFSYKLVAPLIKKLDVKTRSAFKKEVFVDRSVGDLVKNWPYEPPARPHIKPKETDIFQDREYDVYDYQVFGECSKRAHLEDCMMLCSAGGIEMCEMTRSRSRVKTYLDQLFDKYRFDSFKKTLAELRVKIGVENLRNRQDIMLVLISKSGGVAENVAELLNLLISRHKNEPDNLRATVIRSFVRRCAVWRLDQDMWNILLQFGHGLGLDGASSSVPCNEGLHAVILRNLLLNQQCTEVVKKAFLKKFNTLHEYPLTAKERKVVLERLTALLLSEAEFNKKAAIDRLTQLLDTLAAFKIRPNQCPGVVQAIANTVERDVQARSLLYRLFNNRVARKELFKENFEMIQNNASYYNALKYDISVLESGKEFEALAKVGNIRHDSFLRSLSLYFGEQNGLAEKYLSVLERKIENTPDRRLGRPFALLSGSKLLPKLQSLDGSPKKSEVSRFSAALRSNAHLARPLMDINDVDWQWLGSKAIANRVLKCSDKSVDAVIKKLLNLNSEQNLALVLSIRAGKEISTFQTVAVKKPKLVLKTALHYIKMKTLKQAIWDMVIQLLIKIKNCKIYEKRFIELLIDDDVISQFPSDRKIQYCVHVYDILRNVSGDRALAMLCIMEINITEVDGQFIERVFREFLDKEFTKDNISDEINSLYSRGLIRKMSLYLRVITKYILLTENEEIQKNKLEAIVNPAFDRFEYLWKEPQNRSILLQFLKEFIRALKYSKVFLDTKYISCVPVFENILYRMHKVLPVELHYEIYVRLRLTMLFFKSVRQSIQNNPDVFKDISQSVTQAVEIVGIMFGKFIAHEMNELQSKYFTSIIVLFKKHFQSFISANFEYSQMKYNLFLASIIKGILMNENINTHLLAALIYDNFMHSMNSTVIEDITGALKLSKSHEIPFFLQTDSYCN